MAVIQTCIYRCDRCGAESEVPPFLDYIKYRNAYSTEYIRDCDESFGLRRSCANEVLDFIKHGRKTCEGCSNENYRPERCRYCIRNEELVTDYFEAGDVE